MASILVIDDDAQLRLFVRMMLELDGHSVAEASNGKAGILAFRRIKPDLVVCDVFMPDKDGLETIQELRGEDPQLKLVAMSGGWERGGRHDFLPVARQFGAIGLLAKPFDAATLTGTVSKALATRV